jgi:hypothetical protein
MRVDRSVPLPWNYAEVTERAHIYERRRFRRGARCVGERDEHQRGGLASDRSAHQLKLAPARKSAGRARLCRLEDVVDVRSDSDRRSAAV